MKRQFLEEDGVMNRPFFEEDGVMESESEDTGNRELSHDFHEPQTVDDPGFSYGAPASLVWKDICFEVRRRKILNNLSGSAHGRFLALIGSSGSGKTTLLNILARRNRSGTESGSIFLNGKKATHQLIKKVSGYVMQDDLFFSNLTVREILSFTAKLRLPSALSSSIKSARVEAIITELGLKNCSNTVVGGHAKRGISGGERKRLSIGVELLCNPHLLFLDEPTSGLDSATSGFIVSKLKSYTKTTTIICTIHQPSTEIFNMFDDLMILCRGQPVYFGPADKAVDYFAALEFPVPPLTNPADHFLDIISADPTDPEAVQLMNNNSSKLIQNYDSVIEKDSNEVINRDDIEIKSKHGRFFQLFYLLDRASTLTLRNYSSIAVQLAQTIVLAVLIGLVFLHLPLDQTGIQRRFASAFFVAINQGYFGVMAVLTTFPLERDIILRDRAAGTYKTLPYFLAKSFAELPLQILFPLIFTNIVYWMMGYQANFIKWANFWVLCELCNLCAISLGLCVSALSPTLAYAAIITPFLMEVCRLFGGFFSQPVQLPGYLIWIQTISFITYTFTGIAKNEMSNLDFYCTPEQLVGSVCPVTTGQQAIDQFRLLNIPVWGCQLVLLGMIIVFRIAAYIAVRFNKLGSG